MSFYGTSRELLNTEGVRKCYTIVAGTNRQEKNKIVLFVDYIIILILTQLWKLASKRKRNCLSF